MSPEVPRDCRQQVAERAAFRCEYCGIHEADTHFGCQVAHLVARKHGGSDELSNLTFACAVCNRHKGTDLASLDEETGQLTRLFNPRTDAWGDHFAADGAALRGTTAVGRVTVQLLQLDSGPRRIERELLIQRGRYTPPGASAPVV